MIIDPLSDRILVKLVEPESVSKGGIHVPDNAKQRPQEGIVIGVGPGTPSAQCCDVCKRVLSLTDRPSRPLPVVVGDRVLISQYAGIEIKHDGIDHLIVNENDLLGVIRT